MEAIQVTTAESHPVTSTDTPVGGEGSAVDERLKYSLVWMQGPQDYTIGHSATTQRIAVDIFRWDTAEEALMLPTLNYFE